MRALTPRQIDQRLAKLEAQAKGADVENAFRQVIFLSGDDPEGDYPDGTVVIRFIEPGQMEPGEFRLPHNGREPLPKLAAPRASCKDQARNRVGLATA